MVLVTTHTPLAECDHKVSMDFAIYRVTTHTPLAECDPLKWPFYFHLQNYNPRTPAECDFEDIAKYLLLLKVTIPALLRSATPSQLVSL